MQLRLSLHSLKKGVDSMATNLLKAKFIFDELKPISDDDLVHYIMCGLTSEYIVFVASSTTGDSLIKTPDLHGLLHNEEMKCDLKPLFLTLSRPLLTLPSLTTGTVVLGFLIVVVVVGDPVINRSTTTIQIHPTTQTNSVYSKNRMTPNIPIAKILAANDSTTRNSWP
ncbi:hypothetical protein CFOL_v3_11595 [Cephalotus follicularis]|uniref:Uncharacterized protein n=1 Tax=Cephalotus follicularis TaxID=3775 RepID=A0A1Q3BJS5_CEPFO|nr:hypothetical protein CFOL_v3_11595 [Cephalotus follicularis]